MSKVTILDTVTGEKKVHWQQDADVYYWAEGNGLCDCNRSLAFLSLNDCSDCGTSRYLICDVEGDFEGQTKEEVLAWLNDDYPTEFVKKFNLPIMEDIDITTEQVLLSDAFPDMQSLEELWISLAKITQHIVDDNAKCNKLYPTQTRAQQMVHINALIKAIKHHHTGDKK